MKQLLSNLPQLVKKYLGQVPDDDYPVLNSFLFVTCWLNFALDPGVDSMRGMFAFKYANDEVQYYCDTISHNFPGCVAETKDVRDLKRQEIKKVIKSENISLIAGGPPCQAFSILGKRGSFTDLRGQLVFDYIRLINELKPDAFVFENVPGLLILNNGEDWKQLYHYFQVETGYDIYMEGRKRFADLKVTLCLS